jgi:hypothetical protein
LIQMKILLVKKYRRLVECIWLQQGYLHAFNSIQT